MSYDVEDSEVVADLILRASSERDRSRRGVAVRAAATQDVPAGCRLCGPQGAVLVCAECRRKQSEQRAEDLRARTDDLASVIRDVKSSHNPRGERFLLSELVRLGHPDVKGLLDTLDARSSRSPSRRATRESM